MKDHFLCEGGICCHGGNVNASDDEWLKLEKKRNRWGIQDIVNKICWSRLGFFAYKIIAESENLYLLEKVPKSQEDEDVEAENLRLCDEITDQYTQFIVNKTCYPKLVGHVILDESEHLYLVQSPKDA